MTPGPGCPPRLKVAGTLVVGSRWVSRQWIPPHLTAASR